MPIYWYLFIWREPLAARPAAPERARGLPGGGAPTEQAEMRTSTAAVAGLVCSIPGVVCCPIGIVGLILGILALAEIAKVPALRGKTIAIIAIVLGGFSIPVTGIVAATAVPLSLRYLRRAKTAEATENVAYLYRAVVRTYDGSRQLPQSLPRTPATPPCGDVQMWPADAAPGWRALGFTPTEPLRYSYEYVSDGHAFTVRALGDLDGDGLSSTFERAGTIQAGEVVGSPRLSVIREVE